MNAEMVRPEMDLRATHARLLRLERGEWLRWSATVVVTLALTLGLAVLSLPVMRRDFLDQLEVDTGIRSLLGLVLLFDIFVLYQQALITRLRRQLTGQLGLIAALDVLNPSPAETAVSGAPAERRRLQRCRFDEQLRITVLRGRQCNASGRIRDINENGLGAVIPQPLEPGDEATLNFTVDTCNLEVKAVVRYRRGIHYGFEFLGLTDADAEVVRQLRLKRPVAKA